MPITALLFDNQRIVADFLNSGANAALLEGPKFQVTGLLQGEGSETLSIVAVPIGAGRHLTDYRGVRARPNCAICVNPDAGPHAFPNAK